MIMHVAQTSDRVSESDQATLVAALREGLSARVTASNTPGSAVTLKSHAR